MFGGTLVFFLNAFRSVGLFMTSGVPLKETLRVLDRAHTERVRENLNLEHLMRVAGDEFSSKELRRALDQENVSAPVFPPAADRVKSFLRRTRFLRPDSAAQREQWVKASQNFMLCFMLFLPLWFFVFFVSMSTLFSHLSVPFLLSAAQGLWCLSVGTWYFFKRRWEKKHPHLPALMSGKWGKMGETQIEVMTAWKKG